MKLLHTADLHLDSPFEGLTPGKAYIRRKEQRELLSRIANLANSENVDALLLCGDIFDSQNVYRETMEEMKNFFYSVSAPVFILPGNHDCYCRGSYYEQNSFPDNVHIFSSDTISSFELNEKKLRIYGAAYIDKTQKDPLSGYVHKKTDDFTEILCLHGQYEENEISSTDMDYVALGHIHKPSGLQKAGNVYYSQPGCPEGRGFDETGRRYVNIVEIENKMCRLRQVDVSCRKYEILDVNIEEKDPLIAIKMSLPCETIRDIYRIRLLGEADENIKVDDLYNEFKDAFFDLQISDCTRIKESIWEKCGSDSLRGLYLTKMRKLYDEAENEERKLLIEQSVKWGLAAIDNREEIANHDN